MEVVWDGTARAPLGRYLAVESQPVRPAGIRIGAPPQLRAGDAFGAAVVKFVALKPVAISEIVTEFSDQYCKSKVYSKVSDLRRRGVLVVVRTETHERAKGAGPMARDIYGVSSDLGGAA